VIWPLAKRSVADSEYHVPLSPTYTLQDCTHCLYCAFFCGFMEFQVHVFNYWVGHTHTRARARTHTHTHRASCS